MKINKDLLNRIPEFSEKNFRIATYVSAGIIGVASIWFVYSMFTTPDFGITPQWNIFKSPIAGPLFIVGLLLALANWGKFGHWSKTVKQVTYDEYGKVKKVEAADMTDTMLYSLFLPLIGHFLIEPLIYASIIYYPIMCVVAIVAAVLKYVLTIALVAITVCMAVYGNKLITRRNHSLIVVVITLLLGGGLGYASYRMTHPKADYVDETATSVISDSVDTENTSAKVKATKDGIAGIKIGADGGWADSVDGLYDSWEKKTETVQDMDESYDVVRYEFKRNGKLAICAYADVESGKIGSIRLWTRAAKLPNSLNPGCSMILVYSSLFPQWSIDFEGDQETNVTCISDGFTYCTSSSMVKPGKDIPERLEDFTDNAIVTCIIINGEE